MRFTSLAVLFGCCALILATAAAEEPAAAEAKLGAIRTLSVPHPADADHRVEVFTQAPVGTGRWPAVLYVHGFQPPWNRPGGRYYWDEGILEATAAQGIFAASVSQPGFGASDGPSDFCGPRSHQAVHAALEVLRADPRIDPNRIVVYGDSRGAVVASMVATQDPGLAGIVLRGGTYDLARAYHGLDDNHPIQGGIKQNIRLETGATPEAFAARSALYADPPIRVPTLLLHGEDDSRTPIDIARELARRLQEVGTPVELVAFPGVGHRIPMELRQEHVDRFLTRVFGGSENTVRHPRTTN